MTQPNTHTPRRRSARRRALDRRIARLSAIREAGETDAVGVSIGQTRTGPRFSLEVAAHDPMLALLGIDAMRRLLSEVESEVVAGARVLGISWDDIAWALRVTRQTMVKRYPELDDQLDAKLQ